MGEEEGAGGGSYRCLLGLFFSGLAQRPSLMQLFPSVPRLPWGCRPTVHSSLILGGLLGWSLGCY